MRRRRPKGPLSRHPAQAWQTEADVTVSERNRPDDTFGFGVVFSDATLGRIDAADPLLSEALARHGRHWDSIEIWVRGERESCAGKRRVRRSA
jgi:hypothetical protein